MSGTTGVDLTTLLHESFAAGAVDAKFKYGITSLFPKGGSVTQIGNFPLITILTSVYKLMAKFLANRL